jgi:hypothetical protein
MQIMGYLPNTGTLRWALPKSEKHAWCKDFQIDSISDSDDELEDTVDSGGGDFFLKEFERAKNRRRRM